MAFGYQYGGYPVPGYYPPPMPDQLAQLRANQFQQPMNQQTMNQPIQNQPQQIVPPVQNVQPVIQTQGQPSAMSGPVFVNGEAGAKGYLVGAGNTVMLIDADPDANTFWLKSADASGMPSMRTFDYVERVSASKPVQQSTQSANTPGAEYATKKELSELEARVDALADSPITPAPTKGKKSAKEDMKDE